jgi:hypothetical protein
MFLPSWTLQIIVDNIFSHVLEHSGLTEQVRNKLGHEPVQQAFRDALGRALEYLEKQYPQWETDLFDASFLETEGAPILAQFLIRDGHPDAGELAARWADSLGMRHPEQRVILVRELEPVAADFLDYLARELKEESAELTRAHLEQAVLPDAKWERMRADARSGEAEFEYADRQNGYLSNLASLPTFVPRPPDPASTARSKTSPQDATVEQKTPKRKRRVGEPSPRRDPVGTARPVAETAFCSFSGSIELEAVRWLESRVEVVQCPRCGSVSKAKLKGQSVVITPHPPRKVRPVRNVTRWMEEERGWKLVQKEG